MRRRSFIATIPAAAAATASITNDALAHQQNPTTTAGAQEHPHPKFQPEGDDKFIVRSIGFVNDVASEAGAG